MSVFFVYRKLHPAYFPQLTGQGLGHKKLTSTRNKAFLVELFD